jgi:hypothetical protein
MSSAAPVSAAAVMLMSLAEMAVFMTIPLFSAGAFRLQFRWSLYLACPFQLYFA